MLNSADFGPKALTAERRKAVCVHEAAHAVFFSFGGAFVYDLAVAPTGSTGWSYISRKGRNNDVLGVCSASDLDAETRFTERDESGYRFANRREYRAYLSTVRPLFGRRAVAETYRRIRAHVAANLAGPIADQIFAGDDEADLDPYDDSSDLQIAAALADLLPRRGELYRLAAETEATLRRPEVWDSVMQAAATLEAAGSLFVDEDSYEEHCALLPKAFGGWPPAAT